MKTNKKVIFLDLDGTTIDHSEHKISINTIRAIDKAQENGHVVAIATGRAPALLYDIPEKLGVDTVIAANGRYVEYAGKVIYEDGMSVELLHNFVETSRRYKKDLAFIAKEGYVSPFKFTNISQKFSEKFNMEYPIVIPKFHLEHTVMQIILFTENPSLDDPFMKHMIGEFPNLEFNISCEYGVDVNKVGGMKELGVQKLIDYLKIPLDQTIAIGDGFNDVSMIEKVGTGVAMGNACEPLKKVADFVTNDVTEDGIYNAFIKLGLIDKF